MRVVEHMFVLLGGPTMTRRSRGNVPAVTDSRFTPCLVDVRNGEPAGYSSDVTVAPG
jgi:hypothetical protein